MKSNAYRARPCVYADCRADSPIYDGLGRDTAQDRLLQLSREPRFIRMHYSQVRKRFLGTGSGFRVKHNALDNARACAHSVQHVDGAVIDNENRLDLEQRTHQV